ncbi:MAG: glycosyltransferase family 4 protein, partial [Armatimonadetes bacterium]|nr:glycosyltransferase family 4 protein [Armatimonadota bacterium]
APGGKDPATGEACDRIGPHHSVGETLVLREGRMQRVLKELIPRFDPHLIWSSTWFPGHAMVSLCPEQRRGRVACFSAYASEILPNSSDLKQRVKALLGPLRTRAIRDADRIFAISNYTREQVIQLGARPEHVDVVPGGVAREWFSFRRTASDPHRIVTVARLDEHKGHDVVLRALPRLVRLWPDLVYDIIGPGPQERLRALAASLGVGKHVVFHGGVPFQKLLECTARAAAFVMPSREIPGRPDLIEGFGLAYLEAAALGVPCVAGRSGGVPDAVLHGETGFLVDPMSTEEVGHALEQLLGDTELAARLGANGRCRAEAEYTWPRIVEQMLERVAPLLVQQGRKAGA